MSSRIISPANPPICPECNKPMRFIDSAHGASEFYCPTDHVSFPFGDWAKARTDRNEAGFVMPGMEGCGIKKESPELSA